QGVFDSLSKSSQSADSVDTKNRLISLGASFDAFTAGVGEESLQGGGSLESLLVNSVTAAGTESLIVSHHEFEETVSSFPAALGPQGAAAWEALVHDRFSTRFESDVSLGIAAGLGSRVPPYADETTEI